MFVAFYNGILQWEFCVFIKINTLTFYLSSTGDPPAIFGMLIFITWPARPVDYSQSPRIYPRSAHHYHALSQNALSPGSVRDQQVLGPS